MWNTFILYVKVKCDSIKNKLDCILKNNNNLHCCTNLNVRCNQTVLSYDTELKYFMDILWQFSI